MESKAGMKIGGTFHAEGMRPYDQEEAHRIKAQFGSASPEYAAIPRYQMWTEDFHNVFTAEGLTHMIAVTLCNRALIEPFYVVLYEDDQDPADGDTYETPGYTECTGNVDNATRDEYDDVLGVSTVTNIASKAIYTFNAGVTIHGAALVGGSSGKGDTTANPVTHVLLCGGGFTAARAVVDDDIINTTYVVTAADDA